MLISFCEEWSAPLSRLRYRLHYTEHPQQPSAKSCLQLLLGDQQQLAHFNAFYCKAKQTQVFVEKDLSEIDSGHNPCSIIACSTLADELLPYLQRRLNLEESPLKVEFLGAGYSGLTALYAALRHSYAIGSVVAVKPPLSWHPVSQNKKWLEQQYLRTPVKPLLVRIAVEESDHKEAEGFVFKLEERGWKVKLDCLV